ncbi:MAG: aldolase [Rhodospirillaceae bacterium]|jgi:2-keto-3-deoxy-L-rhamnonate aldolase RhmA|nr:aldolase [Rhodospirillaceae bacterium]MBT4687994.1 aldolase [Rhodospirillaceae bacterium]MBT5083492.1 aldolase [Rhodospirillaceae bacterium]MBT5527237.1 aldolase [Rhodospirillaceae bacterium]MBT5879962.1 aldolase [Rhodospirillaceae bacterium]
MRPNPVKTRLAAGETLFGTMIFEFLSPGLPRIMANSGADFVFYDLEHSGFTIEDMKTQFALCAGAGVIPFARPPGKEYQFTSRLLDVGAFGMLYQMVESAEEARELVRWNRYPPRGIRGAIFGGAHDDYTGGDMAEKAVAAMERTFTTVLIETKAGLENIDEILGVDGIDAAHLGHADMSLSLGIPGQFDHPDLQRAVDKIAETAAKHGKTAATLAPNPEWGHDALNRGYRMITYSYDMGLLGDALAAGIGGLKDGLKGK